MKTSKLRLLYWWWKGGPKRLRAAKMRRVPCTDPWLVESHNRAIEHVLGIHVSAICTIHLLQREPDPHKRMKCRRQLARVVTAPF